MSFSTGQPLQLKMEAGEWKGLEERSTTAKPARYGDFRRPIPLQEQGRWGELSSWPILCQEDKIDTSPQAFSP